jgi:nucleoside 2-deoxyribosyltransferase
VDILKKITEEWFNEFNTEIRRGNYPATKLNWFDALDDDRRGITKNKNMKIYLAIPYTFNPEQSFRIANKVSAKLMSEGHTVFSPISHSHPIADHLPDELRTNSQWWMTQDLPLVDWADEVHVVCIGEYGANLIEDSKGVKMELEYAKQNNKPIKIIEYYD